MALGTVSQRTHSLTLPESPYGEVLQYSLPFFQALFRDRSWPILTELVVGFNRLEESPSVITGILSLTKARFPKLQRLTLNIVLPIESTLFPQLTKLDLTGPTIEWPSREGFLACLSRSSRLEELSIDRMGGPILVVPHTPASTLQLPLTLPRLRSLHLGSASHGEMALLLQAIPLVPADVGVNSLNTRDWRQPDAPANTHPELSLSIVDAFFPDRQETMPIPFPRSVRCLSVHANAFWAGITGHPHSVRGESTVSFKLHASRGTEPSRYNLSHGIDDILTLFRDVPLTQINLVTDCSYRADGRWDELFAAFPTLEDLWLSAVPEGDPLALFRALTPRGEHRSPCPALCRLSFSGMPGQVTPIFEAAIECLEARAGRGMQPLQELVLRVDAPKPHQEFEPYLERLRALVAGNVGLEDIEAFGSVVVGRVGPGYELLFEGSRFDRLNGVETMPVVVLLAWMDF
ncbi:uncharacterized protein BXZ73DRAFT_106129 [Epithele typhae]|uniref:uncharacterized protein n=1 Tax=Epithele typhae TaxID=378194 RepID=UPI0020087C06|nr:uncharacterized protein BXZ73DRAFT_106129 [Epithele typhae]KAH9915580.1 hypothetical protein BXZ73DRAFT_106129 [Epithele typhae]